MLPIDLSPSKEKVVKSLRVAEWVCDSSGVKALVKISPKLTGSSMKRKMTFSNENYPTLSSVLKKQKIASPSKRITGLKSSKPMSPRKFYVPNAADQSYVGLENVILPSTPESTISLNASSLAFSPGKLDGIMIRRKSTASPSAMPTTDSESLQSTPAKSNAAKSNAAKPQVTTPNIHFLSCGLDSPKTESTMKSSDKKFSKLGHRVNGKTSLQLYQESIKRSTKSITLGGRCRSKTRTTTKRSASTPSQVTPQSVSTPSQVTPQSVSTSSEVTPQASTDNPPTHPDMTMEMTTVDNTHSFSKTSDEIDYSNCTLTESVNLVQKKLLPLFSRTPTLKQLATDRDQLVIDAGQKNFDEAYQCVVCRMIYTRGDPNDETLHKQFHSQLTNALKFTGWKKENIAERGAEHKVIYIDYSDPPYCKKKVQALKVILDQELGYVQESDILKPNRRIYLYVGELEKKIKGVCIAESITQANRLEDGDKASLINVRANVGINRLWVYAKYRRSGVATKLLDSVRSTFGMGTCVPRAKIAFSDPTSHGKMFATKYTGTHRFLVYKP